MPGIDDRNKQIYMMLESMYEQAVSPTFVIDESAYIASLDTLFTTGVWGFREVLLTAIVAMRLNPNYKASSGFYDCNPRAIYEGPIREFLMNRGIPHRKSGPLNVAKAAVGLDLTWAAQRKPSEVALAVVQIINYLEEDSSQRDAKTLSVGVSLLRRLIAHSRQMANYAIAIPHNTDPVWLSHLCCKLISQVPDTGNTPQQIIALLLKSFHMFSFSQVTITGGEDRASTTSTTSNKPGDINEELHGMILRVYEITVKPFDLARIRDSYECVSNYNSAHNTNIREIMVLCRKEDCPIEMDKTHFQGFLGRYIYNDICYYFADIYEWIAIMLQRALPEGRYAFYRLLNMYIDDYSTSEEVKRLWQFLHSGQ